jgi:hypothetical protein
MGQQAVRSPRHHRSDGAILPASSSSMAAEIADGDAARDGIKAAG